MTRNAKALQAKSRTHEVKSLNSIVFEVTSGASGDSYLVVLTPNGGRCNCKWGQYRRAGQTTGCSHVIAVFEALAEREGRTVSAWATEADASRQRRPARSIGDDLTLTSRKKGGS